MSKPLEQRLRDAKSELAKTDSALSRHASRLPLEVGDEYRAVTAFAADIDHWIDMIGARQAARALLTGLEQRADADDWVALGATRAKFQHVRLIGVQAYLTTTWALADGLSGMAGRFFCSPEFGFNRLKPAQLVAQFVHKDRKKSTAGALNASVRQTFGWPIAVSYALRNHFVHDGGQLVGANFFDGSTAASRFTISTAGWDHIEERARTQGVEPIHHRVGPAWPSSPTDDLRAVLDVCEREVDDALGVLIGSTCRALLIHVGCMLGED